MSLLPGNMNPRGEALWNKFLSDSSCKQSAAAHKCPWSTEEFEDVTDYQEMLRFKKHAGHVMIWCPAKETDLVLGRYPLKYRITMQVRFDGKLGFPGGLIDEMADFNPDENDFDSFIEVIRKGCVREVEEEATLSLKTPPKYLYSSCSAKLRKEYENPEAGMIPGYVMHFFTCEVSRQDLEAMENNLLEILSSDEVLGLTRVPLYFLPDNIRGLPAFLTNAFVGNALEQLIKGCLSEGILTEQEVRFAYYAASTVIPPKLQT